LQQPTTLRKAMRNAFDARDFDDMWDGSEARDAVPRDYWLFDARDAATLFGRIRNLGACALKVIGP
jgi:hypothetical protein